MKDKTKEKLINLGAEVIADALIEISEYSDMAKDKIEGLLTSPKEKIKRFKKKFAEIRNSQRFIHWRNTDDFEMELNALLQEIKSSVTDPLVGLELMKEFYETDNAIYQRCDDSDGIIADFFKDDAKDLFVYYASRCNDKEKVAKIILELMKNNDYGVRGTLIDSADKCLPEKVIYSMINTLQKEADSETDEHTQYNYFLQIKSLAKQIKDAGLLERTYIASHGTLCTAALIDIARLHLENGETDTACSKLMNIPEGETYQKEERDQLLLEIYKKQGNTAKQTELSFQIFKSSHSLNTLKQLLKVIGNDKREQVLEDEVDLIMKSSSFNKQDLEFLIDLKMIDEAEEYVIIRADQLNGSFYDSLLYLAKVMESKKRNLAASLIYRCLLVSILERAYNKAYQHAVLYLKKLDKLALTITDWRNFINHKDFKDQIVQIHGRKRSFWSKYELKNSAK